jgi:type I restriction enzyme S subunit
VLHFSKPRKFVLLTPQVTYYRVRNSDVISNRFLPLIFESSAFQREITRIAGAGSTRAYIGIKKQLELEISYPTLAEQLRLADALDGLREKSQLLEATYKQKMNSLMLLKQSLLHRAFSGELTSSPSQAIQEAAE